MKTTPCSGYDVRYGILETHHSLRDDPHRSLQQETTAEKATSITPCREIEVRECCSAMARPTPPTMPEAVVAKERL